MKIFKFLAIALVAMLGFTACDKDCDHDFIEHDHSADLVGTWTCLQKDFAEALIIKADGSVVSTGVAFGEYWENVKGNIVVENGNATMTFEDHDNYKGHFDIIPGMAFSIYNDEGVRFTYNYCKEDLADEIVGMWVVANGTPDMTIETYYEDGRSTFTGIVNGEMTLKHERNYKVVGDLSFHTTIEDPSTYVAQRLIYSPNATSYGDLMTWQLNNDFSFTRLRIKQYLELPGMKYDYIKTFVSNVKGLDKDIDFMGYTFNFAKMDGVKLDKMLKTLLFTVEFPDANTIKYSCHYNNQPMSMEAPIAVDGNKMTVKMSEKNPAYKDVDLYTFQDKDNTQMHMYMHSTGFVNFFGNMQVTIMEQLGQLDTTDAAAVKAVFDSIDEAVETINLSLVMTRAK